MLSIYGLTLLLAQYLLFYILNHSQEHNKKCRALIVELLQCFSPKFDNFTPNLNANTMQLTPVMELYIISATLEF